MKLNKIVFSIALAGILITSATPALACKTFDFKCKFKKLGKKLESVGKQIAAGVTAAATTTIGLANGSVKIPSPNLTQGIPSFILDPLNVKLSDFITAYNLIGKTENQILDYLFPKVHGVNLIKFIESTEAMKLSMVTNVTESNPFGDFTNTQVGQALMGSIDLVMRAQKLTSKDESTPLYQSIISAATQADKLTPFLPKSLDNSLINNRNNVVNINVGNYVGGPSAMSRATSSDYSSGGGTNLAFRFKEAAAAHPAAPYLKVSAIESISFPLAWYRNNKGNTTQGNISENKDKGKFNFIVGIEVGLFGDTPLTSTIELGTNSEVLFNVQCDITVMNSCMLHSVTWNLGNMDFLLAIDRKLLKVVSEEAKRLAPYARVFSYDIANALDRMGNASSSLEAFINARSSIVTPAGAPATPTAENGTDILNNITTSLTNTTKSAWSKFLPSVNTKLLGEATPLQLLWINRNVSQGIYKKGWESISKGSPDMISLRLLEAVHINTEYKIDAEWAEFVARMRFAPSLYQLRSIPITNTGHKYLNLINSGTSESFFDGEGGGS